MIELANVSRWYGQVIGLNDVSFAVPPGLTALLGPNGAGKSTLFKLITGQLRPSSGRLTVLGQEPFANSQVMARLGNCPEIDNFYEEMTGREFVTMMAAMSGIKGASLKTRTAEAIERVGMADRCDHKLGGYSKGMRQRIKLAQAIVHDPDVIVLDEPLNGLDPLGRRDVNRLMTEFANAGKCVLVSSHILYEVEQITERILVIYQGRLLAQGDVYDIRAQIDKHPHHIRIETPTPRPLASALLNQPSVLGVRFDPARANQVEVETNRPDEFYAALAEVTLDSGFEVASFHSPDNNMESVFKYLVKS